MSSSNECIIEKNSETLTQTCLEFYRQSLVVHCEGKTPCITSIKQYDKCVRLVINWTSQQKTSKTRIRTSNTS
ncbi:MAG: hypothetical protein PHG66_01810 [Candidatus Colwellbacteria bacterium]|nr:hypothetical protein [Candidatus Colwellbacteria bacterium]